MSLYDTYKWRYKLRPQHLKAHPLCVFCEKIGKLTIASVVDHIRPHRENEELFFDRHNLQSLCKTCHDATKQRMEKSGIVRPAFDENGNPL